MHSLTFQLKRLRKLKPSETDIAEQDKELIDFKRDGVLNWIVSSLFFIDLYRHDNNDTPKKFKFLSTSGFPKLTTPIQPRPLI